MSEVEPRIYSFTYEINDKVVSILILPMPDDVIKKVRKAGAIMPAKAFPLYEEERKKIGIILLNNLRPITTRFDMHLPTMNGEPLYDLFMKSDLVFLYHLGNEDGLLVPIEYSKEELEIFNKLNIPDLKTRIKTTDKFLKPFLDMLKFLSKLKK